MMKRLVIDFEDMQIAFEDRDGEGSWFLDTETGDVIRLSELDDDDQSEEIETGGDRYLPIPYQGSEVGHRDMAEFAGSVDDNRLRALLDTALRGSGAFSRFKDVLRDFPQERERWFAFQRECSAHRVRRWASGEGIDAVARARPGQTNT